jgi:predicted nucleotidyltransferase
MASLGGGADCHDQSMVVTDGLLRDLAAWLTQVPGVVGVLLGGSRARGDHMPDSDVDLGLYYRPPLDVAALAELAREVAGPQARVTQPGEWGPWVDGGGWLTIAGTAVDWIYRDLDRVWTAWQDAQRGRFRFHAQVGNPLGVPDFAYAGEVALGVVLADATGELASLQRRTSAYPRALADTLVQGLWEATFLIDIARKAVSRADTSYVAGLPIPRRRPVRARAARIRRPVADQREGRGRLGRSCRRRTSGLRRPRARCAGSRRQQPGRAGSRSRGRRRACSRDRRSLPAVAVADR